MQVAAVMSRASVTDAPSDSLKDAASRMWSQQTGSLLVMDGQRLVGIITERDVMKAVARGMSLEQTPVSAIMTTNVITIGPGASLHEAAQHMAGRWIRHLPVLDDGRVVGMVSQRDLVGVLATLAHDPEAATLDSDELVSERRLERVEHGDLG